MKEITRLHPGTPVLQEYVCEECDDKAHEISKNSLSLGGSRNVSCNYCGEDRGNMLTHYYSETTE